MESMSSRVAALGELCKTHDNWVDEELAHASVLQLLKAVAEISEREPKFAVVDADMPFAARAERLLTWMKSHPGFSCKDIAIVDNLGAEAGDRGVVTREPLAKGDNIMLLPADVCLGLEQAGESWELGPLLDQPGMGMLKGMSTMQLAMCLLIEHAKALHGAGVRPEGAPAGGPSTPAAAFGAHIPPASATHGRNPERVIADRKAARETLQAIYESGATNFAEVKEQLPNTRLAVGEDAGPGAHPWGSKWRAYLSTLPATTADCMFWTAEDWAAMRGTAAFLDAANHLRTVATGFVRMRSMVVDEGRIAGLAPYFTWAAYRWSISMVMTRQNPLPGPTGGRNYALIPVFDMVNHTPEAQGEITATASFASVPATGGAGGGDGTRTAVSLELKAYKDFAAGEEVKHSYGMRAATQLMFFQGFTSPEVQGPLRDMGTPVTLALPEGEDPLLRVRANALKACDITLEQYATAHLRSAANHVSLTLLQNATAAGEDRSEVLQMLEDANPSDLVERAISEGVRWRWPMTFNVPCEADPATAAGMTKQLKAQSAATGKPYDPTAPLPVHPVPYELLTFCRIACMDKTDAAPVLRLMQQHSAAAKAAQAKAAHGHSHGGQACHGHGHGGGEEVRPLEIPEGTLSAATEAKARDMAAGAIRKALAQLDAWQPGSGAAAGGAGSAAAAAAGYTGALPLTFLHAYRGSQRTMLAEALEVLEAAE